MDLEVEALCGAGYGERSETRTNKRNGHRELVWETRAWTVPLQIPKLRKGNYFLAFWSRAAPPRRRWSRSSKRPTFKESRPAP
jgi:transposase-like protein